MVIQNIIFGLELGSYIAVAAIGFTLMYGLINFINFAYGEYMTIGAYLGFIAMSIYELNLFVALALVLVASAIAGYVISRVFFIPIREEGPVPLLLMSIGAGFILRQGYRLIAGGEPRYVRMQIEVFRFDALGGFFINTQQIFIIVTAIVVFVLIHLLLTRTEVGITMRGTANNEDLAKLSGVSTDRVRRNVWLLSSALAGLSGFMLGTTVAATPLVGFDQILVVLAAAILGGAGSAYGAIAGAYIIGLAITFTSGSLPTSIANLGTVVAFAVLIIVLLVRPSGIAGVEVEEA